MPRSLRARASMMEGSSAARADQLAAMTAGTVALTAVKVTVPLTAVRVALLAAPPNAEVPPVESAVSTPAPALLASSPQL